MRSSLDNRPQNGLQYESKADRIYELECDLVEPVHRGLRNLALSVKHHDCPSSARQDESPEADSIK
jgi:hypothetical protein